MKKLKKDLVIWHILSICYSVSIFFSVLPLAVLLQLILSGIRLFEEGVRFTLVYLILAALIFIVIVIGFRAILDKESHKCMLKGPYKIKTNLHTQNDVLALISKNVHLKKIENNCWYGRERLSRELRLFVFSYHDDNDNNMKNAEKTVKSFNNITNFPSLIDKEMHQNMGRIQLYLYEEVPEIELNTAVLRVEENIQKSEFLLNFFIELSTGNIYIPFCCSRILGVNHLYYYAIFRFEKWLAL